MSSELSLLPLTSLSSQEGFIYCGQQHSQPCLVTTDRVSYLWPEHLSLCEFISLHKPQDSSVICLITANRPLPAIEQKKWVIWGQEFGLLFQWMPLQAVIETFNSLIAENRRCQAVLIPPPSHGSLLFN